MSFCIENQTNAKQALKQQCDKVPSREAKLRNERNEKDNGYERFGANGSVGRDEEPNYYYEDQSQRNERIWHLTGPVDRWVSIW